jgi:uncharacterized protein (DUF427 family)
MTAPAGHTVGTFPSSDHVRVSIGGQLLADSVRPVLLHETGIRDRTYLRPEDVRMDLLVPSSTSSVCPFKGTASYWTAVIEGVEHPDVAWSYVTPIPAVAEIAGLLCFYDEKVDLEVVPTDGLRR